jgi:ABC-type sugar transport system ATPase subunit
MAAIEVVGLSKRYGAVDVLRDISLTIRRSETIVFVGPSGCGKSTLLRTIAGFESPSAGEIRFDGVPMNDTPANQRGVAMVFQNYALYPHMTAAENIGFGLRNLGGAKDHVRRRVHEIAELLHIESVLGRRPDELSGGQRQRVAIGRAIVRNPRVFLFDEPLSNLDPSLRGHMRVELARLHRLFPVTTVYVTHDQIEAMTLADRIAVLNGGRIEQVGTPLSVYQTPRNVFVATFFGSPPMNLLPGRLRSATAGQAEIHLTSGGTVHASVDARSLEAGSAVTVGVRPEDLRPAKDGDLVTRLTLVEHLGNRTLLHATIASDANEMACIAEDLHERDQPCDADAGGRRPGDFLRLTVLPRSVHVFDPAGVALPRLRSEPVPSRG